jgi:hypothetical protein
MKLRLVAVITAFVTLPAFVHAQGGPSSNAPKPTKADASALGHKRTSRGSRLMSALPPKADIEPSPVISFDATTPAASPRRRS